MINAYSRALGFIFANQLKEEVVLSLMVYILDDKEIWVLVSKSYKPNNANAKPPPVLSGNNTIPLYLLATEGFRRFAYGTTDYFNINLSVIMTTIPLARPFKANGFKSIASIVFF